MSLTSNGDVSYRLKRPFSDGTTHVVFSPMELMEKLAALIPRPHSHRVRYHGVLAANSRLRPKIVPKPPKSDSGPSTVDEDKPASSTKHISWAKLLKRVFGFEIESCSKCSGQLRVIAAIKDKKGIKKILKHLDLPDEPPTPAPARAPPQSLLELDFA